MKKQRRHYEFDYKRRIVQECLAGVLSLILFHQQFPRLIHDRSGPRYHIDPGGGIAFGDGAIWEGSTGAPR